MLLKVAETCHRLRRTTDKETAAAYARGEGYRIWWDAEGEFHIVDELREMLPDVGKPKITYAGEA